MSSAPSSKADLRAVPTREYATRRAWSVWGEGTGLRPIESAESATPKQVAATSRTGPAETSQPTSSARDHGLSPERPTSTLWRVVAPTEPSPRNRPQPAPAVAPAPTGDPAGTRAARQHLADPRPVSASPLSCWASAWRDGRRCQDAGRRARLPGRPRQRQDRGCPPSPPAMLHLHGRGLLGDPVARRWPADRFSSPHRVLRTFPARPPHQIVQGHLPGHVFGPTRLTRAGRARSGREPTGSPFEVLLALPAGRSQPDRLSFLYVAPHLPAASGRDTSSEAIAGGGPPGGRPGVPRRSRAHARPLGLRRRRVRRRVRLMGPDPGRSNDRRGGAPQRRHRGPIRPLPAGRPGRGPTTCT